GPAGGGHPVPDPGPRLAPGRGGTGRVTGTDLVAYRPASPGPATVGRTGRTRTAGTRPTTTRPPRNVTAPLPGAGLPGGAGSSHANGRGRDSTRPGTTLRFCHGRGLDAPGPCLVATEE